MSAYKNKHQWLTRSYPWIVWSLAASFFFYKYLIQVSPSVMTDDLMKAFEVHGAGLGNLSAFYFYAYLIMQIPVGMMLDKFSPRLLTTAAILVCSISTFVFSHTHLFAIACTSRAFMGAGAAFAAVSCFKLATIWFNPKRFSLVSGLFMTAAMLGAVGGQMPLALLVQKAGWRHALELVSWMGVALSLVYFLVIRDKSDCTLEPRRLKVRWMDLLKPIVKNKQTWTLSLYSGLAFAPVSVFGGLWGVPFLEKAYSVSRTDAAWAISFIFIGFAFGAPFWGWFSDYIHRRKPILFAGTGSALISLSLVIYSPGHLPTFTLNNLITLLFFFGFSASGFFTSFAMIREVFSLVLVATVLAIMNTFNSLFEALFEPAVGAILDWTWNGVDIKIHAFTLENYQLALSLLPLSLIIALLILIGIKETYCKPQGG